VLVLGVPPPRGGPRSDGIGKRQDGAGFRCQPKPARQEAVRWARCGLKTRFPRDMVAELGRNAWNCAVAGKGRQGRALVRAELRGIPAGLSAKGTERVAVAEGRGFMGGCVKKDLFVCAFGTEEWMRGPLAGSSCCGCGPPPEKSLLAAIECGCLDP